MVQGAGFDTCILLGIGRGAFPGAQQPVQGPVLPVRFLTPPLHAIILIRSAYLGTDRRPAQSKPRIARTNNRTSTLAVAYA